MQIDREKLALAILNSDRVAGGLKPVGSREGIKDSHGYLRNVDDVLAEIEAQGFVVVPREPTLDMLQAGRDAVLRTRRYGVSGMSIEAQIRNECVREAAAWSAMIDAGKGEG